MPVVGAAVPACQADSSSSAPWDWLPNVDGVLYFVREILAAHSTGAPRNHPRHRRPHSPPKIAQLAAADPRIQVTAPSPTFVPIYGAPPVAIVPLRIGGGTRLKIYEAMAAQIPVVSTTIGAEGLSVNPPQDIRLADTPPTSPPNASNFSTAPELRARLSRAAWGNGVMPTTPGSKSPVASKK